MNEFAWKEKIVSKISLEKAIGELSVLLDKYDWYYDSIIEGNSICVYVDHMTANIVSIVPEVIYGYQVKLGMASYLTCGDNYGKHSDLIAKSNSDF